MVRLSTSKRINPRQVKALFRDAGWTEDLAHYAPKQIQKLLRHSHLVLSAWNRKKLVGFASAVSDGVLCAMVQNLVVHPDFRRRGLGTALLREMARTMKKQHVSCLFALGHRRGWARRFFERVGFRPLDWGVYLSLSS